MKIDASEDFKFISTKLESIKMTAALAGDDKCMVDVVTFLAQSINEVFVFGLRGESETHKVLMQGIYEKELEKHGFKKIAKEEAVKDEAKKVPAAQGAAQS